MSATLHFVVPTSARLLRVLTLLQTRRFWSGRDLAERLEVTERTVRRDVDRLRSLGYPVQGTAGVAGGYRLGAGASLPPLLLEDEEAIAVAIALGTAANGTVAGIEDAALRALTKLEQVLPNRLRRRVNAVRSAITPMHGSAPRIDAGVLSALAGACRDRELATFEYPDRGSATKSSRTVEPHGLVHSGFRWYLVAWDRAREDFRTFRVDRITSVTTKGRFTPRPLPERDLATYVSRSVSTNVYPVRVRILLHAPVAELSGRISPAAGMLQAAGDDRSVLTTGGYSADLVLLWVAQLGVDFEVLEPAELTSQIGKLVERLERATTASRRARR